jgi:N-acetylneuraminic acid mutarotase
MIVWGGLRTSTATTDTGGIYDPSTNTWTSTATTGAPTKRSSHSATWTGAAMIVWGGADENSNETNTGASFDPTSNRWQPMSVLTAPGPRRMHTAVWTGSRMIAWGGFGATRLDDGGVYDPATDTWTATSIDQAPSGRYAHAAVWTGSFMIVWGGSSPPLRSGGRYALGHAADDDGDGLSECDGDCADADGDVFAPPAPIEGLTIAHDPTLGAILQWQSDAANSGSGTTYDVLRGALGSLPDFLTAGCLYDDVATSSAQAAEDPDPAEGFYYLIRGQNVCASGSWGESSAGTERVADACP